MCAKGHNAELFIGGEPSPDLIASVWLLRERGYRATSQTDLPKYMTNGKPDHRGKMMARMVLIMNSRAVVLHDDMTWQERRELAMVCRFTGQRLVQMDELPLYAEHITTELLDKLNVLKDSEPEPTLRERFMATVKHVREVLERWELRFNVKCGWFFTNGQKSRAYQAPPVQYPMPKTESNLNA